MRQVTSPSQAAVSNRTYHRRQQRQEPFQGRGHIFPRVVAVGKFSRFYFYFFVSQATKYAIKRVFNIFKSLKCKGSKLGKNNLVDRAALDLFSNVPKLRSISIWNSESRKVAYLDRASAATLLNARDLM